MKASARRRWAARCVYGATALLGIAAALPVEPQQTAGAGAYSTSSEDPGLEGLPGRNRKRTAEYVFGSAGERSVRFVDTPKTFTVKCHNAAGAKIAVWPEARVHLLDHRHAMMRGRVVARLKNVGRVRCSDFALKPGDEAYWWMGPDLGEPLTTEFWRIDRNGAAKRLAVSARTQFNEERKRYDAPDACIGVCMKHEERGKLNLMLFSHGSTWITCLDGCCQSMDTEAVAF